MAPHWMDVERIYEEGIATRPAISSNFYVDVELYQESEKWRFRGLRYSVKLLSATQLIYLHISLAMSGYRIIISFDDYP